MAKKFPKNENDKKELLKVNNKCQKLCHILFNLGKN